MNVLLVLLFLTSGGVDSYGSGYTEKIEMSNMRDCQIAADKFRDSYYSDASNYDGDCDIFISFSAVCIRTLRSRR